MARHFPDFLESYAAFARDNFVPDKFHYWTGLSILAGAAERKIWTIQDSCVTYPNLYIVLVARPAMGKSSAGNLGVNEFLYNLGEGANAVGFLGTQNSEAGLEKVMERFKKFTYRGEEYTHSSYFMFASEGANSLKEIRGGGALGPILTDFYDCKPHFTKELAGKTVEIHNGCLNILACCTFDALEEILGNRAVEGGLASRLICVAQNDSYIRRPKWDAGAGRDTTMKMKLLDDLTEIYQLTGPFTPTDEFARYWEDWFPRQDGDRQALRSERMQNFLSRKHTNLLKIAMLCSVSESNSMTLELKHWQRAEKIMSEVDRNTPGIAAKSVNKMSPKGAAYITMKVIQDAGGFLEHGDLTAELSMQGLDTGRLPAFLMTMISGRLISKATEAGDAGYKLLANPDDYL